MRIDRVYLENFRNYAAQTVTFHPACNVICGENAQGKTNLLEALVYLSCGRSPRARADREMIGFQGEFARLEASVFARDRDFRVRGELYRGRRRRLWVNQVPLKSGAELGQVYHTVFFCPEDLFLIREGAAARRRFMDVSLCQLRPNYGIALNEYARLHEHKTRILRDRDEKPDLLDTLPDFNRRMAEAGAVLIHYRARFAKLLSAYAENTHRDCSGGRESLEIQYTTVKTILDPFSDHKTLVLQLLEHQKSHYQAELSSRQCLSGPHKDDLYVTLNGLSARSFASQGQTRTAALSFLWKAFHNKDNEKRYKMKSHLQKD